MAKPIKPPTSETRTVAVNERSWRVELFTEIPLDADISMVDFPVVVHREWAEESDPAPPGGEVFYKGPQRGKGRGREIAAEAGMPANGTDGTDPSHYTDPVEPFFSRVEFTMGEVVNAVDDQGDPVLIDITDGDGNVLIPDFPLAYLPAAIVSGIEYMVQKKKDTAVASAVARAVAEQVAAQSP